MKGLKSSYFPVTVLHGCWTKSKQKPLLFVSVSVVASTELVCTTTLNGVLKPVNEDWLNSSNSKSFKDLSLAVVHDNNGEIWFEVQEKYIVTNNYFVYQDSIRSLYGVQINQIKVKFLPFILLSRNMRLENVRSMSSIVLAMVLNVL